MQQTNGQLGITVSMLEALLTFQHQAVASTATSMNLQGNAVVSAD